MCINSSGAALQRASCNLGPLAVVAPLLEQMDVAAIIDRHLPPDRQLGYSHGQVLRMLLGARLSHPLALVNVAGWAEESGAEFLWGIPADKLRRRQDHADFAPRVMKLQGERANAETIAMGSTNTGILVLCDHPSPPCSRCGS